MIYNSLIFNFEIHKNCLSPAHIKNLGHFCYIYSIDILCNVIEVRDYNRI